MKSLGNVLNALNCIPKMVGFMLYTFNYSKQRNLGKTKHTVSRVIQLKA